MTNHTGERQGVMVPIPQYPLYSATLAEYDLHQISYYLDEDRAWGLDIEELERCVRFCTLIEDRNKVVDISDLDIRLYEDIFEVVHIADLVIGLIEDLDEVVDIAGLDIGLIEDLDELVDIADLDIGLIIDF